MKRIYGNGVLGLVLFSLLWGYEVDTCRSAMVPQNEFLELDLAALMQVKITSVGKKPQELADAPAAVFVISNEDIKRSGVTLLPEVLRMAPGLQVARVNSSKWAISSRGFNGAFSNKLLVLIDGRSVYTPAFSGVYWENQDVMLEDVERIEIVRGPGATLWGANAVNGVINIITKKASETKGGFVSAGAGSKESAFGSVRYGMELGDGIHGRAYLKYHDRDSLPFEVNGRNSHDQWDMTQGGFRLDGERGMSDTWTLQGDMYDADENQVVAGLNFLVPPLLRDIEDDLDAYGWNILGRWRHEISETSSLSLQSYYDVTKRDELFLGQSHKTFDVEVQHQFQAAQRHDIIWGLGYRVIRDDFDVTSHYSLDPEERTSEVFNFFVQDEIELINEQLWFTVGSKFENNDFTGGEIQPSARLLWKPGKGHTLWSAASRAVRTPSRTEDGARILIVAVPVAPPPVPAIPIFVLGNPDLDSEELNAYEIGYRFVPNSKYTVDIATFYNDYDNLVTGENVAGGNNMLDNKLQGSSYGLELAAAWHPKQWASIQLSYTYQDFDMEIDNDSTDKIVEEVQENSSPQHQLSLRTTFDISEKWQLNLWGRYVDELDAASFAAIRKDIVVDDYLTLDANIIWRPLPDMEIMIAGQNLFDSRHLEFVHEFYTNPTEVERGVYGKVSWRF